MNLEKLFPLAGCVALLSTLAFAGETPDISGTWLVDAAKSSIGSGPAPADLRVDIRVEGADFYVKQSGGGQPEIDLHFNSAGKETTNEVPGALLTSTHRWEGPVLVGEIKVQAEDGTTLTFKDKMTYSADGKVMTMTRDISGPMGSGQMTLVMNRK